MSMFMILFSLNTEDKKEDKAPDHSVNQWHE